MNNSLKVLIAGFPRAGKSTFADAVERSVLGLVHIPMDRYIMPIPDGRTFLDWVKEPSCVDWKLLKEHLGILESGRDCYTPKPDWSDSGRRLCLGGPKAKGLGRKMRPGDKGYLLVGTHVFSLTSAIDMPVKVFIETTDAVIASRLEGRPVSDEDKAQIIRKHLDVNIESLRKLRNQADLVIDGTWPRESQIRALSDHLLANKRIKAAHE